MHQQMEQQTKLITKAHNLRYRFIHWNGIIQARIGCNTQVSCQRMLILAVAVTGDIKRLAILQVQIEPHGGIGSFSLVEMINHEWSKFSGGLTHLGFVWIVLGIPSWWFHWQDRKYLWNRQHYLWGCSPRTSPGIPNIAADAHLNIFVRL